MSPGMTQTSSGVPITVGAKLTLLDLPAEVRERIAVTVERLRWAPENTWPAEVVKVREQPTYYRVRIEPDYYLFIRRSPEGVLEIADIWNEEQYRTYTALSQ